jgi:hypothetical protein
MRLSLAVLIALGAFFAFSAVASAATYEGSVKGKRGDEVSFLPFPKEIADFFVNDVVMDCGKDELPYTAPLLGFEKGEVTKSGRITSKESPKKNKVRYHNELKGQYSDDLKRAKGKVRFKAKGKINGKKSSCETPWLKWTAHFVE